MHHINLAFGTDTCDTAIVTHTDEQPPAIGIGKGRNRSCQLAGVINTIFEILLLMLALAD